MEYKIQLQELVQNDKNVTIAYQIIDEKGPSHNKEFQAQVQINGEVHKIGVGRTKKEAEQRAAKQDRKSTRLNSSHVASSYAVFCLKKKTTYKKMRRKGERRKK